mmetsp:Transcript_147084/g.256834  ORF Transcript_147084/g.256834 Transcript_147084/m.256834 type:complete len:805 (-) Transcript_147084:1639-4053(-)
MADTLKPVPARGLHIRNVDPSRRQLQAAISRDGIVIFIPHLPFLLKSLMRGFHHLHLRYTTALWPIPLSGALATSIVFAGWVLVQPTESWFRSGGVATAFWYLDEALPYTESFPTAVRVLYLAILASLIGLVLVGEVQRLLLRRLLAYTRWMHEGRSPSVLTKAWFLFIKYCYVRRAKPLLYSYQDGLPSLVVPLLKDTCDKLLVSLEPVLSAEEFIEVEKKCADFQAQEGPNLQRYLHLKSWINRNYVSDWWLRFVYLRGRGSLLVHSNIMGCGDFWEKPLLTTNQVARAASLIHQYVALKRLVDRHAVEPLRINDVIPMCMAQYQYLFSSVRVPCLDTDRIHSYAPGESQHIVVLYKGVWYRINIHTRDGKRTLTAYEYQTLLRSITEYAEAPECDEEAQVAALTTENRTVWAEVREVHFHRGINRASLDIIERAMFCILLDDHSPQTLSEQAKLLLAGSGGDRWCDKSFSTVIFANGRNGMHVEHSWGDAPVASHMMETCLARELLAMSKGDLQFDEDGFIKPSPKDQRCDESSLQTRLQKVQRLRWIFDAELKLKVQQALLQARNNIAELDLHSKVFKNANQGLMKKCKHSPDAFVQMAIQLAYYRLNRRFVPTYEPAMMRLWVDGRTETIRSCSKHSAAWVRAMEDSSVTDEERARLLKTATEDHQLRTRQSMSGQGIDRHLFALYVVSRGRDIPSPLLDHIMNLKWTLSTSQVPWRQANKKEFAGVDMSRVYSSGGAFGPVDPEGYGVCYAFMDDAYLMIHVSSRVTTPHTDSTKFMEAITEALSDMATLCGQPCSEP